MAKKIPLTLGVKAKDIVTGFTGIVTGHCRYLTGCDRYQITPAAKPDGTVPETMSFDENSIEVLDAGVTKQFGNFIGDAPLEPQPPKIKRGGPATYKLGKSFPFKSRDK